jgi:hypothetical protein
MIDAAQAWREFCGRMADLGSSVLDDDLVGDERDQAEGLRHVTRQMSFALAEALEFGDADFPAFHRSEDDVTKWGGPNADNNYLRCAIDPAGTYRLTADMSGCREAIFSMNAGDMQLGHFGVLNEKTLQDFEIDDGHLELAIAPDKAPGNWMASGSDARQLTIRVYVVDWATDSVPDFYIERLDTALDRPAVLKLDQVVTALDDAATWVETSIPFWLRYIEAARSLGADNTLTPPQSAAGGAADIAYGAGCWSLDDGDAWLIEFEPPDALHWSIQTHTWPWFESGDLAHAQTSLNDSQTHVDADGKYYRANTCSLLIKRRVLSAAQKAKCRNVD